MASEQSHRYSTYLAAVSAHRARRGAQQALRFAAFNEASFRGGGQHYKRPDCDINIFLHGELARPETLRQLLTRAAGGASPVALPEMQPARALKHDMATLDGVDVLISAHWWTSECRFPQPAVDGMRRAAVTPVFKAYYGKDYMENRVAIQVGNSSSTALACVWAGDRFGPGPVPPPSFRRLFFYGTLTDPEVLRRVLQASPRYELNLIPAVLYGWHIRWWGEYPALVRGAPNGEPVTGYIYDCPGDFIDCIETYEGDNYVPTQVQVALEGSTQLITAWSYAWNGTPDSLHNVAE